MRVTSSSILGGLGRRGAGVLTIVGWTACRASDGFLSRDAALPVEVDGVDADWAFLDAGSDIELNSLSRFDWAVPVLGTGVLLLPGS